MNKTKAMPILVLLITELIIFTQLGIVVAWSGENPLITLPSVESFPSIAETLDGRIWVVCQSDILGNSDIIYRFYNWSYWTDVDLLTDPTSNDISPSLLQAANGTTWLFWSSDRMENYTLFYKTSSDGGLSWSTEKQLTEVTNENKAPSAAQTSDGKIWVVWQRTFPGPTYKLFYKIYNGTSWSDEYPLTSGPNDRVPSIAQMFDDKIWVTWTSYSTSTQSFDIFYKVYTGSSWSDEIPLIASSDDDTHPSILQAKNGTIWVVWESSTSDVYYKISSDNGANWSTPTKLTTDTNQDKWPEITQTSDKNIWVVWASDRYDDYDIFYKTLDIVDIVTTRVSPWKASVVKGSTVKIDVEVKNEGALTETFNVTVYHNSTAIGSQKVISLAPNTSKTLTFAWNTTDVPLGNYVMSATAQPLPGETDTVDNSMTDGTIRVKVSGDVNGDGVVDIVDINLIFRALGTDPRWPHGTGWGQWNPDADVNNDLICWVEDLYIVGKYYGTVGG